MAVLALFFLFVVPARARQGGGMYERLRGLTVEQINQKGEDCIRAGRHDSAIAYYQAAADRYDDGMDAGEKRICVDAMCNAGAMAFADRHDYVGAYALLVKALGVAEDNGFDYIKPYVYLNLAGVHTVFGDSTMNDRLCRKAFEMGKRLNDAYIYKLAFVELVYTAAAGGNFEAIRNELADFGRSWPDMGKGERDYAMLIHLGISAYSKGRYAEALGCYDEADRLVGGLLEADLYHLIIDMLAARAYSAQGRYAEAVATAKQQGYIGGVGGSNLFAPMRNMSRADVVCVLYRMAGGTIDNEGMTDAEKARYTAEAKIILASKYFDGIRHFGGLPIVDHAFSGEEQLSEGRSTIEATVNYAVGLLDQAIAEPNLPWALPDADLNTWAGRMTKGAAYALKAKILHYAASPIFNNDTPYCTEEPQDAVLKHQVWYGGYKPELWQMTVDACKDFWEENARNGNWYCLSEAATKDLDGYRDAFYRAYIERGKIGL